MVSERKKLAVEQLKADFKKYPIVGIVDMYKLPAKQLQEIKDSLRGKAVIKMAKKSVIKLAMEGAVSGLEKLEEKIRNQPAILLSDVDPFELARVIDASKSSAAAKPGDIAPRDIVIKEGPTSLKPGPVIGELQRVKLPAGVDGDKIVIKKDAVIVKEGEHITKPVADVLMKLGVQPMEIALTLMAVYDRGTIYGRDILFIPREKYESDLINAYRCAFNLALNIGLPTEATLPILLAKAYREAMSLAVEANIMTKDNVEFMLAKANAQMVALKDKVGDVSAVNA
ncbi:MAG: 50S ribosomal protein L10 [Candidatus Aenigmarchaeota archaeon]|nr:50S ribosomal protein L10 [Candidatus Aenigmarchaeota archaeon]